MAAGKDCYTSDCYAYSRGDVHHHVHVGPEDVAVHQGEEEGCETPPCGTFTKDTPQDEKFNAVQEDLIKTVTEISDWWVKTAKSDAERTVPKAVEYGAVDFDLMGMYMVALVRDKFAGADDAELMAVGREMAVAFYLIGKMGRMVGAYQQGVMPSDDTIFDTGIYAMMMRRIRETGRWV